MGLDRRGFTLIEVVTVILLVGILTAVMVYRNYSLNIDVVAHAAAIRNHIRYAQVQAMRSGNALGWGIRCDGTDYWLFENADPNNLANQRRFPGEEQIKMNLGSRRISIPAAFLVKFNPRGVPCDTNLNPVNAAISITVNSVPAGTSQTITITADTGLVP